MTSCSYPWVSPFQLTLYLDLYSCLPFFFKMPLAHFMRFTLTCFHSPLPSVLALLTIIARRTSNQETPYGRGARDAAPGDGATAQKPV